MAGNTNSGRGGGGAEVIGGEFTMECPDSLPDTGKEYWAEIVPLLVERKILTDLDGFAVTRLCQLYAEWMECVRVINVEGMFYEHALDRGNVNTRPHPAAQRKDKAEQEITRLSAKFGLTPKDRESIKAHKGKKTHSVRDAY